LFAVASRTEFAVRFAFGSSGDLWGDSSNSTSSTSRTAMTYVVVIINYTHLLPFSTAAAAAAAAAVTAAAAVCLSVTPVGGTARGCPTQPAR